MIEKNNDISKLNEIFNEYKENYNPIINEFTNIYTYIIDNNIVGFLIFTVIYDKCEIIDIFVKKENRNKGIACKLIYEISRDFTVDNITLEVSENNKNAINLYSKLGFMIVAKRKNYYKDSNGLLMLKEIR